MKQVPFNKRYTIDQNGRVFDTVLNRYLKITEDDGYLKVRLVENGKPQSHRVHRILFQTFKPQEFQPDLMVRHLNDDRLDNRLENLAIGDHFDNAADAKRNMRGCRLSPETVREIRKLYASGKTIGEIDRLLRLPSGHIRAVVTRRIWKQII